MNQLLVMIRKDINGNDAQPGGFHDAGRGGVHHLHDFQFHRQRQSVRYPNREVISMIPRSPW